MAKSSRKAQAASKNDHEVKTEAALSKMTEALNSSKKSGSPIVFLIYFGAEEWCGPCQRYRALWDEYKKTKGRKIPMIHMDHKMKDKSDHFSKTPIDGFPTNGVYSPNDDSFTPIENIHDKAVMTKLLKADPSKLMKERETSATPTPSMREKLVESGRREIKNKDKAVEEMNVSPPNTMNDALPSLTTITDKLKPVKGGSLFQSLLRAAKGLGLPTRRAKRSKRRTMKN